LAKLIPFKNYRKTPDFLELTAEGSLGIDEVRNIQKFLSKKPYRESHKVVHVPEANRLTIPAQQAFLKTLEEPPDNSILILSLSNEAAIIPTIVSRCQVIRVKNQLDHDLIDDGRRAEIDELLQKLKKFGIGDRVMAAQEWAYPKTKASEFVLDLVRYFRQGLKNDSSGNFLHNLKLADKAYDRLQKNVDPKLTMEYLFLNLRLSE